MDIQKRLSHIWTTQFSEQERGVYKKKAQEDTLRFAKQIEVER